MQCVRCGKEMINTTGGNEYCPKCGLTINDLVYRPSNCDLPMPQGFGEQKGWICPVCGRGLAPWVSCCPCMNTREIVFNSKTDEETISLNGTNSIVCGTTDIEVKI
ncbi:MAG: hypothetical protein UHD64_11460 [Bacteroidales bacterium]|nr:hypothetical protein [Bacteroidales bacterium]